MAERLTKSATRNIFYGGSAFFLVVFVALTVHSHLYMNSTSAPVSAMGEGVVRGKHVWERNSCINCHTLLGEGAYFAPELANVMTRWGVEPGDHEGAFTALKTGKDADKHANAALNGLTNITGVEADAFEFLRTLKFAPPSQISSRPVAVTMTSACW